MMTKAEMQNIVAKVLCGDDFSVVCNTCIQTSNTLKCTRCRIVEKTEQQLKYILSSIKTNVFLEACAGSGKTEVLGMKMSYEVNQWESKTSGIAVLTFTNEATNTIQKRVEHFSKLSSLHPHYIGTLTGFIHGFIGQKFGYKYMKNCGRDQDFSFRLIDKTLETTKNHWLHNYKSKIPCIFSSGKQGEILGNQIYYDYQKQQYIIQIIDNYKPTISEYYFSETFQNFISKKRSELKNDHYYEFDYVEREILNVKKKFLKDGFANFEDMNNISYKVLQKDPKIASVISNRFPVIFIDECQDLSWIEIQILKKLQEAGSILHFIGDLNQAIYDFKNADPSYTKEFVTSFENHKLTDNFRSCQPIVDIANRMAGVDIPILGRNNSEFGENSVCYFEYDEIELVQGEYLNFLNKLNISPEKSSILVRQTNLKTQLLTNSDQSAIHLLFDAIQLWKSRQPLSRKISLEYAGKQLQKWFGGAKGKDNYYCPVDVTSVFRWRIFIKDVIETCCSKPILSNYEGMTYGDWYREARKEIPNVLQQAYQQLIHFDMNEKRSFEELSHYKSPPKTSDIKIGPIQCPEMKDSIKIKTIHSVKGCDFDSVLVVSSKGRQGNGGHWKHWIEGDGESRRIGYVASTRAKYLLIWAVPRLTKKDQIQLETYGFNRLEIV